MAVAVAVGAMSPASSSARADTASTPPARAASGAATSGPTASLSCASASAATYRVARGDTWFDIARGADVTVGSLVSANDTTTDRVLHPDDVLCLPSGATVQSNCRPSNAPTYRVERGDSWFDIARSAGVTVGSLVSANDTTTDRLLHPGDVVCLPSGATTSSATVGRSAGGAGGASASSSSSSSSSASSSSSGGSTYRVASGDGWFDIADRAGVSVRALLDANGATTDRLLHPGDEIRLPAGAAPLSSTAAPSPAAVNLSALPMHGPCWYVDSWHAPRGGGRVHLGVDLFATVGTYVYAVTDGTLTGRIWDGPGSRSGNAWWLTASDGSGTRYFYAHLADFAPGLGVGSRVQAGQIIGFMGNTGNSSFPHLHFEVWPNGRAAVNPYPIVRAAGGCKSGDGYRQPSGWVPTDSGYRP